MSSKVIPIRPATEDSVVVTVGQTPDGYWNIQFGVLAFYDGGER